MSADEQYLTQHREQMERAICRALNGVLHERAANPLRRLAEHVAHDCEGPAGAPAFDLALSTFIGAADPSP